MSIEKLKPDPERACRVFNDLTRITKIPDASNAIIQELTSNNVIHWSPPVESNGYAEWQELPFPMTET